MKWHKYNEKPDEKIEQYYDTDHIAELHASDEFYGVFIEDDGETIALRKCIYEYGKLYVDWDINCDFKLADIEKTTMLAWVSKEEIIKDLSDNWEVLFHE